LGTGVNRGGAVRAASTGVAFFLSGKREAT